MKVFVTPRQFASLTEMMMRLEDDISVREDVVACLGKAASATPKEFRDLLISLAASASVRLAA